MLRKHTACANDSAGLCSNTEDIFSHLLENKKNNSHSLISELNNSKNEVFPKSFTYAAELNISVSFNITNID